MRKKQPVKVMKLPMSGAIFPRTWITEKRIKDTMRQMEEDK